MDKLSHFISLPILTFGSSSIILVLGFLLLGVRIPKEKKLRKLHIARKYLSLSYFILAGVGLFRFFMHIGTKKDFILIALTLFIAAYQALLFTSISLTFIRIESLNKKSIYSQLYIITLIGIPFVLSSVYYPSNLFPFIFCASVVLYLFQLIFYCRLFRCEYHKSLKVLEHYYDEDENDRLQWVKFCFYSALGIGILALVSLFLNTFLYGVFIVIYTAYYSYMVSRFYNYITDMGFLMPALSSVKTAPAEDTSVDESLSPATEEEKTDLTEREQRLKVALEKWVEEKLYCQKDIGVDDIVDMLGTSRNFLRYYFRCYMPADFRTWRAELRIAEAKKIIKENPQTSLEEICQMTGFNHRANFHRQFQKITGQTPTEYRNSSKD